MGKVQRYFTKSADESSLHQKPRQNRNNSKPVLTYDIAGASNKKRHKKIRKNKSQNANNSEPYSAPNSAPKIKGRVPIPENLLKKYGTGEGVDKKGVKTRVSQIRIEKNEASIKFASEQAARAEILLTESVGYLEADEGETTTQFTQKQIAEHVDIAAASKQFALQLQFGPYRAKYTRNGRHLLLGGKKGHVAAFDWVTKKLHCEINVMESVHDISWLHIETMFAVAQKDWVYIYDNQGIELHCVKRLHKVCRMEFLPYHFLLATCSDEGFISWLDVSIGKLVNTFGTKWGRLSLMTQNPWNAVLCLGTANGVVSMWSPNSRDPLAKMFCHKAPLSAIHVDPRGMYMATASTNRELKIWDIRQMEGPLQEYKMINAATSLSFSQKDMLAVGMGNVVEIYRDCCSTAAKRPYLRNRFTTPIVNSAFCPYEDVLGVATYNGFTSMLVPGAGEANFDAFEANPMQSKSQRREAEVKSLLEKIQPELITLDPTHISEIDIPTLRDKVEAKEKLLHVKAPKIDYEPRRKAKGKGGSVKIARNKKIVQEQAKKEFIQKTKDVLPDFSNKSFTDKGTASILDRFLSKKGNNSR